MKTIKAGELRVGDLITRYEGGVIRVVSVEVGEFTPDELFYQFGESPEFEGRAKKITAIGNADSGGSVTYIFSSLARIALAMEG